MKSASPETQALYRDLLRSVARVGKYKEESKKTCVHLVRKSAFLGVHPRKEHLLLTVKSPEKLRSPRVFKAEQASARRWYIDLKITSVAELDPELIGWIRQSYDMSD